MCTFDCRPTIALAINHRAIVMVRLDMVTYSMPNAMFSSLVFKTTAMFWVCATMIEKLVQSRTDNQPEKCCIHNYTFLCYALCIPDT